MRILCLLAAVLVAAETRAQEKSLLAEVDEDRGNLGELLHLSGSFWSRLLGDRPEGNPFDELADGLKRYDMSPEIGGVVSGSGIGLGFTHAFWHGNRSAIRLRALGTTEGYFQVAVVHDTLLGRSGRFRLRTGLLHRDLAQEDFYGLGLASGRADRTDYGLSETALGSELDIALRPAVGLRIGSDFRRIRARGGENPSLPSPELLFSRETLAGYGEDFTYATIGASIFWDTREVPAYPRRGSLIQGDLRQFVGLGANAPGFRRFGIEIQNALPLPGHDHGLVARIRADWLDQGGEAEIPFFFTRGLGGSHTLRGFPLNRFRGEDLVLGTLEYRSAILPGKLDAVVFWDTGGAYKSFSELSLEDLEHSFGAGIRILRRDRVLLRLEVARGSEGTRFLVSFSRPF
jgi:hypothetical protein